MFSTVPLTKNVVKYSTRRQNDIRIILYLVYQTSAINPITGKSNSEVPTTAHTIAASCGRPCSNRKEDVSKLKMLCTQKQVTSTKKGALLACQTMVKQTPTIQHTFYTRAHRCAQATASLHCLQQLYTASHQRKFKTNH